MLADRRRRHRTLKNIVFWRDRSMSVELSEHVREEIDRWVAKFPPDRKRSAVISALHAAQHEKQRLLDPALMDAVAAYLGLPNIHVYEVGTFYSMFRDQARRTPPCVGMHQYSCMLRGSQEVVDHVEKKLGIKTGESTPEWRIFLKPRRNAWPACTGAPMMMVDHIFSREFDARFDRSNSGRV